MSVYGQMRLAMKEHAEAISQGIIVHDMPRLSLNPSKIEIECNKDSECDGEFVISAPEAYKASGVLSVYGNRIILSSYKFSGSEIRIMYRFSSRGLEEGDVVKGEINIISQLGEYVIPYVASVKHSFISSSDGPIKNLFHFSNLAQSDFKEAVKVFYKPEFKNIFVNNDRKLIDIYRGYLGDGVFRKESSLQNVENFLVAVKKKTEIEYSLSKEELVLEVDENSTREIGELLVIKKNTWGYVNLLVQSDADFITPEKDIIDNDDFVGNDCELMLSIDPTKLHAGRNFAKIKVVYPGGERFLSVTVIKRNDRFEERRKNIKVLQCRAELIRCYLNFRIHNITKTAWEKKCDRVVDILIENKGNLTEFLLYRAHILISQGKKQEADRILKEIAAGRIELDEPVLYGYYLYLVCMQSGNRDFIREKCKIVHRLYLDNREQDMLLWILLYIDEELLEDASGRFLMLRHQCELGGISPLLYLEAYHLIANEPSLLASLDRFELQVIWFAIKTGLFSEEVGTQIVYLAGKEKNYNPILDKILKAYFEEYESDEILQALCAHLMKGNRMDESSFEWYSIAVDRGLRITRLYEFYMYSVPSDFAKELPKALELYFSYSSSLDVNQNSFLYSNIIQYHGDGDQLLDSYRGQIEDFATRCVKEGKISSRLSDIYDFLWSRQKRGELFGEKIQTLAFMHRITVPEGYAGARYIVVIERAFGIERKYPITGQEAYVPIFGKGYVLFVEDEKGVRGLLPEGSFDEPIMRAEDHIECLMPYENKLGVCVFFAEFNRHYVSVDSRNARFVNNLVSQEGIRKEYRDDYRRVLWQYYYDNDMAEELDDCLRVVEYRALPFEDRGACLDYMTKRDLIPETYDIVSESGSERLGPKTLMRICLYKIDEFDGEADQFLLNLCYLAFKLGKYDEKIIVYLIKHLEGTTKVLRNLWKAAQDFGIDTYSLEERIILQLLYAGSYLGEKDAIFAAYLQGGANQVVEHAYITTSAYEYLVHDGLMDESFYDILKRTCIRCNEINDICALSLIKICANEKRMGQLELSDDALIDTLKAFIRRFVSRHIVLEDFMCFSELLPELIMYENRTFVEYKTDPDSVVSLHYILEDESEGDGNYRTENMKNTHNGIFSRSFQIFFGETLQYYITEEKAGETMLTKSLKVDRSDMPQNNKESRYDVINDMILCLEMGEYKSLLKLMDVYRRKKYVTEKLFDFK